jgi:hypothetical protein
LTSASYLQTYDNMHEGVLDARQLRIYAALFTWRDRVGREMDECVQYVLPNRILFTLAKTMPTRCVEDGEEGFFFFLFLFLFLLFMFCFFFFVLFSIPLFLSLCRFASKISLSSFFFFCFPFSHQLAPSPCLARATLSLPLYGRA